MLLIYVVLGYIKISGERAHQTFSRIAQIYYLVIFFMHRRTDALSLSESQCGTCCTHLLNLLQTHGHENVYKQDSGFNFKHSLLMLLPKNNKIFVSEVVSLSPIQSLQYTALASFMQHPSLP